mgnify:CR=1 FL=1
MNVLLREIQVREDIWVLTLGEEHIETSYGANCTAIIGSESVLVVDPLIAPALARLVENAIAGRTNLPGRFVVLTHHHTDHALGAGWFASRGATVAAHPACRDAMAIEHRGLIEARRQLPRLSELFRDAEPYVPGWIVTDPVELDVGGSKARIFHPGPGHTRGDLVVHLPHQSVVVCGDLVSVGYHVNYEDAAVENLENGIRTLRELGAQTYVPGHGPPGGAEILDEQFHYHAALARASSTEEILRLFPGYALTEVVPQALAVWRKRAV